MKTHKPFYTIALIILIALSLSGCAVPRTQPTAPPIRASASSTTVVTKIEPSPTAVPTLAPTAVIGNKEYRDVFEAVWRTVDRTYFDPDFEGLDWDAVHDAYEPLIAAAEDDATLCHLLNQMLWELNVSHTGVGPADMWPSIEPVAFEEGEIGIDVRLLDDRAVITRVEAESPAEGAGLRPGFVIQSIDGVSIAHIIADAQGHLSPPYNERGRIDGLTRRLLSLIYGDPETCVTLAYLDENEQVRAGCIERFRRRRLAPMVGNPLPPAYLEFESRRLENGMGYIRFNTFHRSLRPSLHTADKEYLFVEVNAICPLVALQILNDGFLYSLWLISPVILDFLNE